MNFDEYQQNTNKTAGAYGEQEAALMGNTLGLVGESGELANKVKKMLFHGHPDMPDEIREEVGDILWYAAQICTHQGWNMSEVAQENLDKLAARYPRGFTYQDSIERIDRV